MTKDYFSHLTPKEQHILKDKGTEAPFKGEYNEHFDAGIFICRACENPLYESNTKFNSGCGWPSFFQQLENDNVGYRDDNTHGMHRVEIFCKQCDSHLGHVFPDGPEPSGQRYCVNSISLTFKGNGDVVVKG